MNFLTKTKKHIFIGLLFCGAVGSQAQDVLRVNLKKAIEIALSDNPTIQIADKEIERVDYGKKGAVLSFLPTFDGTAQYIRNINPQTMVMAGQKFVIGQDNSVSLGISASLPLLVPALWRSMQMTELEMQMAIEKARSSKLSMEADVKKAYYNVLLAQASLVSLQESYDLVKQSYEDSKKRYDVGATSEYDNISAEVQMRNLVPSILQMENAVKQTKMLLKMYLGVNMATEIELEGKLSEMEKDVVQISDYSALSLDNNSELKQLDIQIQQVQKQLQLQRTQRMPTLVAFGNYQYQGSGMDDDMPGMNPLTGEPMVIKGGITMYDPAFSVGLQLNVPLFHGFTNVMKEKQTKIAAKELALQRDYVKTGLSVQAVSAMDNMKKAADQIESNKKNMELANKAHVISQKRYDTGMGTMLELRNATLALTQANLSYSQAIADYLNAKAEYEKIVGKE